MSRRLIYVLLALVVAFSSCSKREGKVIPREKMAHIYADMFVADQEIAMDMRSRRTADTSLVYEPIFRKYGYTTQDYLASVEHYIKDADRFARILRRSSAILDAELKHLKAEKKKLDTLEEARDAVESFSPDRLYYIIGDDKAELSQVDSLSALPWPVLPHGVSPARAAVQSAVDYFDMETWAETTYFGPVSIATHAKKLTQMK